MVYLRQAKESDIDLLFNWANDSIVRKNSFESNLISYNDHEKWFHHVLMDQNLFQYIMMDDDVPVGQIRLIIDNDSAEIGYSIAPSLRGEGYGNKILQIIVHKVKEEHPQIKKLIAKVKPDNEASKKVLLRENFKLSYLCYSLDTMCSGENHKSENRVKNDEDNP